MLCEENPMRRIDLPESPTDIPRLTIECGYDNSLLFKSNKPSEHQKTLLKYAIVIISSQM